MNPSGCGGQRMAAACCVARVRRLPPAAPPCCARPPLAAPGCRPLPATCAPSVSARCDGMLSPRGSSGERNRGGAEEAARRLVWTRALAHAPSPAGAQTLGLVARPRRRVVTRAVGMCAVQVWRVLRDELRHIAAAIAHATQPEVRAAGRRGRLVQPKLGWRAAHRRARAPRCASAHPTAVPCALRRVACVAMARKSPLRRDI